MIGELGAVGKNRMGLGSGGGSVGRAVASNTRYLRFEFHHRQNFIYQLSFKKTSKRGREWPILKNRRGLVLQLNSIK